MAPSTDQVERQIADVRGSMESKIVELRDRSQRQVRRVRRRALIALGTGAVLGVAVLGVVLAYRLTRPATAGERLQRLMPPALAGLARDLRHVRQAFELGMRRQVPSIRLYVGERQVGETPPASRWERVLVRAAQAAATAAASAFVSRLLAGLAGRRG